VVAKFELAGALLNDKRLVSAGHPRDAGFARAVERQLPARSSPVNFTGIPRCGSWCRSTLDRYVEVKGSDYSRLGDDAERLVIVSAIPMCTSPAGTAQRLPST
jgi:hypothetical protein